MHINGFITTPCREGPADDEKISLCCIRVLFVFIIKIKKTHSIVIPRINTAVKTVNYDRINNVYKKKKFKTSHYILMTILTFALILFQLLRIRLAH